MGPIKNQNMLLMTTRVKTMEIMMRVDDNEGGGKDYEEAVDFRGQGQGQAKMTLMTRVDLC